MLILLILLIPVVEAYNKLTGLRHSTAIAVLLVLILIMQSKCLTRQRSMHPSKHSRLITKINISKSNLTSTQQVDYKRGETSVRRISDSSWRVVIGVESLVW